MLPVGQEVVGIFVFEKEKRSREILAVSKKSKNKKTDDLVLLALQYIAAHNCAVWDSGYHCLTDQTAIADRCWPCYVRAALGMPGLREVNDQS